MSQRFESRRLGQRVTIDKRAIAAMFEAAAAERPHETGGILIGRYAAADSAYIDHATTAPGDSKSGAAWFERGTAGLEKVLRQHWDAPVRRYYVGEWHFHPAPDAAPSGQDVAQMLLVATDRRYDCRQPILVIVAADHDLHWNVRVFSFPPDGWVDEMLPVGQQEEPSP